MAEAPNQHDQFERTWQTPTGWLNWVSAVNNQPLGIRFMVTAFMFMLLGGVLALLMRIQLTVSDNHFIGPEVYNQLFTMHGSTMMYLFAVPFLEGLGLYLLPMMIGSRDVAFPRLTQFGYWTYLFGGLVFYSSFLFGTVPDAGWFAYTPLSGPRFTGLSVDFWLLGLSLVEIGGIVAGVEIVVSILKFRAPGMGVQRMPLLVWAMLVAGIMIIFAFTTLLTATVLLELDRAVGTRIFEPEYGGNTILWQHLFWFFGHPEVYIIFIPATGIVSMIVSAFALRLSGYVLITMAIVVTGFLSFGLWVHHMYATGLPTLSMNFFAAASLMIALASGTQVFAWIATLWGRRPALKTPLLYVLGFLFIFVLGGLTGVMIAIVPFDWQVHDTFFIVAHFHYVLIGGALFPILAGLHYWLPKITGRMMSERLGVWSFWLAFIGFNVTFFPMHIMGFFGMPRRVYTYPAELGLDGYNILSTAGAFVMAGAFVLFILNLYLSLTRGTEAKPDPWGGDSLEWSVSSPPPNYTWLRPPVVHSRHPMWSRDLPPQPRPQVQRAVQALEGAPADWRGTLTTSILLAEPMAIQWLPGPTYKPLMVAIGLLIGAVGVLVQGYILAAVAGVFAAGATCAWLWPNEKRLELLRKSPLVAETGLPIFTTGPSSPAWWGMICLLCVLGMVFGAMFFSYFYIRLFSEIWPQGGLDRPRLLLPGIGVALMLASSGAIWNVERSFRCGSRLWTHLGLGGAILLGLVVAGLLVLIMTTAGFAPQDNAYASLFHVISGTLLLVLLAGVTLLGAAQMRLRHRHNMGDGFMALQLQLTGMYWHFTVVASVVVYAVVFVSPYLI